MHALFLVAMGSFWPCFLFLVEELEICDSLVTQGQTPFDKWEKTILAEEPMACLHGHTPIDKWTQTFSMEEEPEVCVWVVTQGHTPSDKWKQVLLEVKAM